MKNEFKTPTERAIRTVTHGDRPYVKPKLNPPQFEEALQTSHNRLFGMAIMRVR